MSIIKFELINLTFPSFKKEFVLKVDSFNLHFKKVQNYDAILKSLQKNKDSQITCTVEFECGKNLNIEGAINLISKVNHLLTFCFGTIINYKSYTINGQQYQIEPISSDFSIRGLIWENDFDQMTKFVEDGFKKFEEIDKIYTLRKLSREYAYTRKNHSFVTVRAYVAIILIEYLVCHYLDTIDYEEYIISQSIWNDKSENLKKEFANILESIFLANDVNSKQRRELIGKIKFLNEKPLIRKMKRFIDDHNLAINEEEMNKYVKIRNELVHESSFPDEDNKIKDFWFVLKILDNMLLSLFKYEGRYFNYYDQEYQNISFIKK